MKRNTNKVWLKFPKICHYTTLECFKNIYKENILRASRYDLFEDPGEIEFSKEYLLKTQRFKLPNKTNKDVTYADIVNDIYNSILMSAEGRSAYISSFTASSDQIGLDESYGILSMWRYFGNNGGICIEFNTKNIYESLAPRVKNSEFDALVMDECVYPGAPIKSNCLSSKIRELEKGLRNASEDIRHLPIGLCKASLNYMTLTKHPAYFEEREIRLAIFTQSKSNFIELPFQKDSVLRLIVGPGSNQNKNHQALTDLIPDINIIKSKIPFRHKPQR